MEVERVRLLRADSELRSPHQLARCHVSARSRRRLRLVVVAVSVATALAVLVTVLPVKHTVASVSGWIDGHHVCGALLLPVMFGVAIPLAIPATMLEILSGSVFGLVHGALLNAVGKTCGSVVAFLVGKRLGKDRLGGYLQAKFPVFSALSSVMEGPNWKPLLLIQLSSLPPVVKCYGLSITDVQLLRFTVTSFVGGFPSAALWAYIGHQTKGMLAGDVRAGGAGRWLLLVVGLVCTALAMGLLVVYTRRELHGQLVSQQSKGDKRVHSTSDDDEDATESEETVHAVDDEDVCAVVVTQVAATETEQEVVKRISIV